MKALSDLTGVPEEHLKILMDKGIISCSWAGYEEIYYHFKAERGKGLTQEQALSQTSADRGIPRSTVYWIVKKFE